MGLDNTNKPTDTWKAKNCLNQNGISNITLCFEIIDFEVFELQQNNNIISTMLVTNGNVHIVASVECNNVIRSQ